MPNSNIFISITMAAATELQEILADCIYFIVNFVKWTIGSAGPWAG